MAASLMGEQQLHPEQLCDESEEFVCQVCMMVLVNPMVTTCSHLVCSPCMSQWVAKQRVNAQKQKKALDKVSCPSCAAPLERKDVTQLAEGQKDASQGALRLLWRLYNDQQVRCLHHPTVQKLYPKGLNEKAAEALGKGLVCSWEGPRAQYEEHYAVCKVAASLAPAAAGSAAGPREPEDLVEAGADYVGGGGRTLEFRQSELIEVLFDDPTGWSFGRMGAGDNVREGWFPRAWCFSVKDGVTRPEREAQPAALKTSYVCERAFDGRGENEISVALHEEVAVLRREQCWALVAKVADGEEQRGWVPLWALGE